MLSPQLDACIEGDVLRLEADLPGVQPENIELTFQDGVLTIKGDRRESCGDGGLVRERRFGHFERRITLPEGVDENSIDARYENGVLVLTARMKPGMGQQRRIQIAGGPERTQARGQQQAQQVQVQPEQKQPEQKASEQRQGSAGEGQRSEQQGGAQQQRS